MKPMKLARGLTAMALVAAALPALPCGDKLTTAAKAPAATKQPVASKAATQKPMSPGKASAKPVTAAN